MSVQASSSGASTASHAPGEVGNETWLTALDQDQPSWEYSGNTNMWAWASADEELGYVYVPLSTPTNDYYGGYRPGDNLFAEAIVCLDARTGERIWHFQAVHHGIWDYDFPAAPNVVDIHVDGRSIQAVAAVKQAGIHLRLRPGDGRASLADRGAPRRTGVTSPGSGIPRSSRFPPSPAVRPAGHECRRSDRLHPRAATGSASNLRAARPRARSSRHRR